MIKINENNEMEIYNIVPIYRGNRIIKFLTSASIADVINVKDRLTYDVETQRGNRIKRNGNRIKEEHIMSKKNIEEMRVKILDDFFDGGVISWNVRISDIGKEKEVVEFVPEDSKIIIKSKRITIPDSAQRHEAIWGLKDYTFSLDQRNYNFPLSISLYTFTEEQSLFSEINGQGSKCSKTRALYLGNSIKNKLLKEIIKESKLKDNVEVIVDSIYRKDKVIAFATLFTAMFDKRSGAFRDLEERDIPEFKKWMIKFFDELISIRPELDKMNAQDRYEWSKITMSFSPHAWMSYVNIAKEIKGDANWRRKLSRLAKPYKSGQYECDLFSYENKIWHGTIMVKNKTEEWKLVNNRSAFKFCNDIILKHMKL